MLKRVVNLALATNKSLLKLQSIPKRNSGTWVYRTVPAPASSMSWKASEVGASFLWWWIFWHLWHEHEHITGEFEYPDRLKWTDEELGIPPE